MTSTGAVPHAAAFFGRGTGSVILDDLVCNGDEDNLMECPRLNNCNHDEDAGVTCQMDGKNNSQLAVM